MNTCKTCRFWGEHQICRKQFVDVINGEREFKADSMRVHVHYAWAQDGPAHVHNVFTGPDFGCIHYDSILNKAVEEAAAVMAREVREVALKPVSWSGKPCSCPPECPDNCKGECGCEAHADAWQDFLSNE